MFAASIPSPDPDLRVLFDISGWLNDTFGWSVPSGIGVHTYALCLMLGMLAAYLITEARLRRRGAQPGVALDISLFALLFGIIGARVWHVLTHPDDYFAGQDVGAAFRIWEGGIAIFGALLGGALGAWIGCRITGIRFWSYADALAPGLLVAQAIGRLGNWFNHELFGMPTDLPWGLEIESDNPAFPAGLEEGTLFHPTFLYELVWNLIGVAVILFLAGEYRIARRRVLGVTAPLPVAGRTPLQWGRVFGLYLIWYGLGRTVFESIRVDPSELFLGIRSNVWGAVAAVVLGVVILVVQGRRHPGREPGVYMPGREWRDPSAVDSEDTYPDLSDADPVVPSGGAATSGARSKA